MHTFLIIVGALVCLLASAALAFGACCAAMEVRERRAERIRGQAHTAAIREIGAELAMGSHWYYEGGKDAPALLVKCIGEHMMKYGTYTEQQVRDDWRRARKGTQE